MAIKTRKLVNKLTKEGLQKLPDNFGELKTS